MLVCFGGWGARPLQTNCVEEKNPNGSKGCLLRLLVGFHVGLLCREGARPLQTYCVQIKYFFGRSEGCLFGCQVGFHVGLFRGEEGLGLCRFCGGFFDFV